MFLAVRGSALPGAVDGVRFYMKPDWNELFRLDVQTKTIVHSHDYIWTLQLFPDVFRLGSKLHVVHLLLMASASEFILRTLA